jgi:putative nucleotidyltransferase with HDIG domain
MSSTETTDKNAKKQTINLILFLLSIRLVVVIESVSFSGIVIVASCYTLLFLFLYNFRRDILDVSRQTAFILGLILLFVLITKYITTLPSENLVYIIPFALIPLLITTFYDSRLALFILLITLMLCGFMINDPYNLIFINLTAGIAAILSLSNINRKYKLLFSSLIITLTYVIVYPATAGSFSNFTIDELKWFFLNGVLIFTSYPVIALFERRFYFLSDATMLELSDSRNSLLRRLSEEAPGSYQHSLQVANLAEAASKAIGANILLARTGALYHDIGKIVSSDYFIENQKGEHNPHIALDPYESSKIIIGHVAEGVKLATEYKLPVQITDFIKTHHGTTKAYYFYRKYLEQKNIHKGYEQLFAYSGPKPFSREMAIVMMADAVEAASRTLDKFTEENIITIIDSAIMLQEQDEQYADSPLTFRDITKIKEAFRIRLSEMHHARIAYPVSPSKT